MIDDDVATVRTGDGDAVLCMRHTELDKNGKPRYSYPIQIYGFTYPLGIWKFEPQVQSPTYDCPRNWFMV